MSLSIAIAQVQLRPQYHPSYSTEPKSEAGRPISPLRAWRKAGFRCIDCHREKSAAKSAGAKTAASSVR